jgi:hypothetical protein
MLVTDMRVIYVYEHDLPTSPIEEKDKGTVNMLFYYADSWGGFFKSPLFDSIRPLLRADFSWILINQEGQTK